MRNYTYSDLVSIANNRGANLADVAIGRMMDIVEEETGRFPHWDEVAPSWVIRNVLGEQTTRYAVRFQFYIAGEWHDDNLTNNGRGFTREDAEKVAQQIYEREITRNVEIVEY